MRYVRLVLLVIVPKSSIRFMLVIREYISTTSNSKTFQENSMYDPKSFVVVCYHFFKRKKRRQQQQRAKKRKKEKNKYKTNTHTYLLILPSFSQHLAHPHRINNLRRGNLHRQTRHPPPIPSSILPHRDPRHYFLGLPYLDLA